jgi:hypothetical protein
VELATPEDRLNLIEMNSDLLRSLGIFEEALLHAYTRSDRSTKHRTHQELLNLFALANRQRLRALGDPLPHAGPYTLYRGVAGRGVQRWTRGLSWTGSREAAVFFARRAAGFGLICPAILTCCVPIEAVLFYTNQHDEDEYVISLPPETRITGRAVQLSRRP